VSDVVVEQGNARSLHDPARVYVRPHEVIKGYCLEIAQKLFYDGNPTGYVWDIDQAKTQVTIADKYAFNLSQVGANPAVVANRGPLQWSSTSAFRQMQSIDMRTDRRTHTDLVRGSATLSCFSRAGEEAELIAGYLFEAFRSLRDVMRKVAHSGMIAPNYAGFFKVETTTMGEEALVKASSRPEISVVPIAILAMVQRRWSVEPKSSRKLQNVVVRTSRSG
jgi:hypothetical protein